MNRQRYIVWKRFDNNRWAFLKFAEVQVYRALKAQIKPFKSDMDAEFNPRPLEIALDKIYKKVGIKFANDQRNKIQRSLKAFDLPPDWNEIVEAWMANNTVDLIKLINSNTQKYILQLVQEAIQGNLSVAEFRKKLEAESKLGRARALRIARTEVIRASNFGAQIGAESIGIPMKKEWLSTPDNRTRDIHMSKEVDGQIVNSLKEPFMVGGEELMQPGDAKGSAWNTINCRCIALYHPYKMEIQ